MQGSTPSFDMTRHPALIIAATATLLNLGGCADDANYARRNATTNDRTSGSTTTAAEDTSAPCGGDEPLWYAQVVIENQYDAVVRIDAISAHRMSDNTVSHAIEVVDFNLTAFFDHYTDLSRWIQGPTDATCSNGFVMFSSRWDYITATLTNFYPDVELADRVPLCVGDTIEVHTVDCEDASADTSSLRVYLRGPDRDLIGWGTRRQDDGTFRIVRVEGE